MLLVHLRAYVKILVAWADRLVIVAAFAYAENLKLTIETDLFVFRGYQLSAGISIPNALDARFAKSSAISSSPILRCRLSMVLWSVFVSSFFSKTVADLERDSSFHL